MKLLITGADRTLGRLAAAHFRAGHSLRLAGGETAPAWDVSGLEYRRADLREPEQVAPLVEGIDAVLHLDVFDPTPNAGSEQERLDIAARGTYVLVDEARRAGADRVVLASTLALLDAYPEDYVLDEAWQPEPEANAESLAPFLSEIVCREFAREGGIRAVCLRFGALGQPGGTPEAGALRALERALELPFEDRGYRWLLFHISSSERFSGRAARELGVERGA